MRQRRDLLILLGLFLALVLFTMLGPGRESDDGGLPAPTTRSSGPRGALALLRWAGAVGYDAQRLEFRPFALDPTDAMLIILAPAEPVTREQVRTILAWVEQGGTLIYAVERRSFAARPLLDELNVSLENYDNQVNDALFDSIERAPVLLPALNSPPLRSVLVRTETVLRFEGGEVAPLVGLPDATLVAGIRRGEGYIYLSSTVYPFTNDGLRDEQNAAFVLNLLRRAGPGGRVLFDEYHHGFFDPPSLRAVLLSNAWGWALIYALGAIILYLLLTGRRFGRPVPLYEEIARRSSAEYVESMADLLRRGRKHSFVGEHYVATFKRRLARPYGVNPRSDDNAFIDELSSYREFDQQALAALLARLRRPDLTEEELLRLVAESDQYAPTPGKCAAYKRLSQCSMPFSPFSMRVCVSTGAALARLRRWRRWELCRWHWGAAC